MGVYMVDHACPGATMEQLLDAQRAVIAMSQRFSARGERVRFLRSAYIPSESRCLSMFEAVDSQTVAEVNEVVHIPFTRIIEAVDLSPEG